jgi:hypothetical protein
MVCLVPAGGRLVLRAAAGAGGHRKKPPLARPRDLSRPHGRLRGREHRCPQASPRLRLVHGLAEQGLRGPHELVPQFLGKPSASSSAATTSSCWDPRIRATGHGRRRAPAARRGALPARPRALPRTRRPRQERAAGAEWLLQWLELVERIDADPSRPGTPKAKSSACPTTQKAPQRPRPVGTRRRQGMAHQGGKP